MVEVSELRLSPVGVSLPILGEDHPLRRKFPRTFAVSATVAILIACLAAGGRLVAVRLMGEEAIADLPRRVSVIDVPAPAILEEPVQARNFAEQMTMSKAGDVVPVPDYDTTMPTFPTEDEMRQAITTELKTLLGDGASLVADARLPSAGEYIAVEVQPVPISTPQPEYPAIARQAGVEGTVVLRILVDKEGDVRDVIYVSGPDMLKEAAIAAAKGYKFRPALQQQRPVAVWVLRQFKFSLNR